MLTQLSQSAPVSSRTPSSHRTSEHDGRLAVECEDEELEGGPVREAYTAEEVA